MAYRILCRVNGGITGTREAFLKVGTPPEIREFDTHEAALAEARRLSNKTNGNPFRTADFRYTVVDAGGWHHESCGAIR